MKIHVRRRHVFDISDKTISRFLFAKWIMYLYIYIYIYIMYREIERC